MTGFFNLGAVAKYLCCDSLRPNTLGLRPSLEAEGPVGCWYGEPDLLHAVGWEKAGALSAKNTLEKAAIGRPCHFQDISLIDIQMA